MGLAMVDAMGETLAAAEAAITLPTEFVVPGETRRRARRSSSRARSRAARSDGS